jgi:acyl-CoA thioesterase
VFSQQEWQQQVEEIIRDRTRYSPYYLLLGMRVKELRPGMSLLELEAGPHHLDERGQVHPGVIFSLADAAAGVAAVTLVPGSSRRVVTVEMKLNYIRGCTGGTLTAVGRVTGEHGSTIISEVDILGEDGEQLAKGLSTLLNLGPGRPLVMPRER